MDTSHLEKLRAESSTLSGGTEAQPKLEGCLEALDESETDLARDVERIHPRRKLLETHSVRSRSGRLAVDAKGKLQWVPNTPSAQADSPD